MSDDPMNRTSPRGTFWMWAIIIALLALLGAWLSTFAWP
jgi:hypothetical protein